MSARHQSHYALELFSSNCAALNHGEVFPNFIIVMYEEHSPRIYPSTVRRGVRMNVRYPPCDFRLLPGDLCCIVAADSHASRIAVACCYKSVFFTVLPVSSYVDS